MVRVDKYGRGSAVANGEGFVDLSSGDTFAAAEVQSSSVKFSIIIPVYNVAPYLRECLDSVLAQTFTDWEAICVDDGSTDGSGAILDEYAARDSRFRVIHQANAGVSAARNAALDVARGEWIGFVDGDDVINEDWIDGIQREIDSDPDVVIVRTRCTYWFGGNKIASERMPAGEILWGMIARCGFPFVCFAKRHEFGAIRFPDCIRMREDALYQFRVAVLDPKVKVSSQCGYLRRGREESASHQCRRRDDTTKLLKAYLEIWNLLPRTKKRQNLFASTYWVKKDIRQWFEFCAERHWRDSFRVWRALWRIVWAGGFSPLSAGTVYEGFRWMIYLFTACPAILSLCTSDGSRTKREVTGERK